jgi:peptide/nickel transport system substrate-binding protein
MKRRNALIVVLSLLLSGGGTACTTPVAGVPQAATPLATTPVEVTSTPRPAPTPTPIPPKALTICQAEEPNTHFLYGSPSRAARNVLEAIYDGPFDTSAYQFAPVILEKLPNLADGDAVRRTVVVEEGQRVVDAHGLVMELRPGVSVIDAAGETYPFEGGAITMTQMAVTFTLRSDVTWADGEPVTADDSRYSFELVGQFDNLPIRLRLLHQRTQRYEPVDDRTVVWESVPGYHDTFYFQNFYFQNFYFQNFYHPLPRHAWGTTDASQLLNSVVAQRKPLGWGAFAVEEWVAGDRISLIRNPHYFRASEGLPYLDRVTFRFVPGLDQALDLLLAGECDLITQDLIEREAFERGDLVPLLEASVAGHVQLVQAPSNEWEHLDFGLTPVETVDRPDFFGDERVRHALAMCIHRERITGEAFPYAGATVARSYVASEHPLYAGSELYRWDYNPSDALLLLEDVGWLDEDGDGIREAHGVPGIFDRTPFSVTLLTNSDHLAHRRTAGILMENLAACGIGVHVEYLPSQELFADGPDGPVFGRRFDLALFSWLNDLDAPCWLYLSDEIPRSENWWSTSNNPGYASEEFDTLCKAAMEAFPGTAMYKERHVEAQRVFSYDLPIVPLYFVPKLVATRPGVSGVRLDPSEYLDLWNIEAFDVAVTP